LILYSKKWNFVAHSLAQCMQCIWIGGDEMKDKMIEVVYLGYQETIDGTFIYLFNEVKGHSTVEYDPKKHIIINKEKKGG